MVADEVVDHLDRVFRLTIDQFHQVPHRGSQYHCQKRALRKALTVDADAITSKGECPESELESRYSKPRVLEAEVHEPRAVLAKEIGNGQPSRSGIRTRSSRNALIPPGSGAESTGQVE